MQLLNKNNNAVEFDGRFHKLIGNPVLKGSWIVWGQSGNGKTRFVVQLMKYLTMFARVGFNSMEEGDGETIKKAFAEEKMEDVNGRLIIIDNENFEELIIRLQKKKSPHIIVVDSLQYLGISWNQYKQLKEMFPRKLFIWVSHADGKFPEGRVANKVRFDSHVKIRVFGFMAMAQSRYGTSSEPYVIWEEGAEMFGGKV